jgi:UDP-hydrolysing UDP-N-acetyl-D-glucosamine 2-epimerase
MLIERFGLSERVVEEDGYVIDGRVYMEVEGSTSRTMVKSIGLGILEFSNELSRLDPDIVLIIGDRYEALAAAVSAAYMRIPIAHIQGGEVSGSLDESARHAITKLAHLHFPSTARSAEYIVNMGEDRNYVHNVGCPAGDYILKMNSEAPINLINNYGVGAHIDTSKPFLLVIYHPLTTSSSDARKETEVLIEALASLAMPTIWIWPNIDAGSNEISKALRAYRENKNPDWLHLIKNLEPTTFQACLKTTVCAIGNSSSFVRDSTFSGTPVVLLGDRQIGREHGENVVNCDLKFVNIVRGVKGQLNHGKYKPSGLYGDGNASIRILEKLKSYQHYTQKTLHYDVN